MKWAWQTGPADAIVHWVYLHDCNMMLWEEIYRGQEAAALIMKAIMTRDYYVLNYRGQDLDTWVGDRMTLPKRIQKLRTKFSNHTLDRNDALKIYFKTRSIV